MSTDVMSTTALANPARPSRPLSLRGLLSRLAAYRARQMHAYETRRALCRLDEHLLRDINLTKADIELQFPRFPSQDIGRPVF